MIFLFTVDLITFITETDLHKKCYLLVNKKLMPWKFKFETPLEQNEDYGQDTKQHSTTINQTVVYSNQHNFVIK